MTPGKGRTKSQFFCTEEGLSICLCTLGRVGVPEYPIVSSVQGAPGWLFDIRDEILPSYIGIIA